MTTVKFVYNDDIRRVSLDSPPTYEELVDLIQSLFKFEFNDYFVKWTDDEGDVVTVSSDLELKEAFSSQAGGILKLTVCRPDSNDSVPKQPKVTDAPPATAPKPQQPDLSPLLNNILNQALSGSSASQATSPDLSDLTDMLSEVLADRTTTPQVDFNALLQSAGPLLQNAGPLLQSAGPLLSSMCNPQPTNSAQGQGQSAPQLNLNPLLQNIGPLLSALSQPTAASSQGQPSPQVNLNPLLQNIGPLLSAFSQPQASTGTTNSAQPPDFNSLLQSMGPILSSVAQANQAPKPQTQTFTPATQTTSTVDTTPEESEKDQTSEKDETSQDTVTGEDLTELLVKLEQMGFHDEEQNLQVLKETNGDVVEAVSKLLQL
eukprot:CAMPEP_0174262714 /NCGR_PEP_ID=MMETSP0439-20130205/14773_1 /TAXON_ID=0 /ORGANISM="Stereomyxa ramosa, Strain Chinc5" /LENGTH=373 /DNA_ID=CAMNT_0015347589 /DNA_START=25 /DNA_END=1146 /DNA_ORIENTATION=-